MAELDTASIRAAINAARWPAGWQILDLCDALDVARAELEEYKFALVAWKEEACVNRDRAEAAEARIAEYEEKLTRAHDDREAAEARIAAALADHWCQTCDDSGPCHTVRALTEGTGQ